MFDFEPETWSGPFDVSRADGTLALIVRREEASTLVVRARDGASRELLRLGGTERITDVAWNPDGASLYFVRSPVGQAAGPEGAPAAVWRMPVTGGDPRPTGIEMPALRALAVSPDGRQPAFTAGQPIREPWVLEHFLPPAASR